MGDVTERLSIADLKRMHERDTFSDEAALLDVIPVLVEIVEAELLRRIAALEVIKTEPVGLEEWSEANRKYNAAAERAYAALSKVTL